MIVQSFVHRLPRVLGVASSLLYKCNDAINTFGCKQSFSQSINTHTFSFPDAKVTGHIEPPVRGLLKFPRQCWNLTSIQSYGGPRFSPEHLTEAQIIDAVKSGEYDYDYVALWFSRKQLYKHKKFSPQFRRELGDLLVKHYSSLRFVKPKAITWLLSALANLNSPISPSFIDVPLKLFQTERNSENSFNELVTMAGFLPLLNWSSIPPRDDLISMCQLIMPMIPEAQDRYLAYLLHTWCRQNRWKETSREYLITKTCLKECQRRVPNLDVRDLTQLLEAVSHSLPLPSHVRLPPGWLEAVQKRLLSPALSPSNRAAATLLDAFEQIQITCCPTQTQLSIPVAKRMFKFWFDPKQMCLGRNQTLTSLVLRAMGKAGIDPGRLDERFWPWFRKEIDNLLNEERDDGRAMVLVALYEFETRAPTKYGFQIRAPTKCVQKIIDTITDNNPMLAADLLYSLARIIEHMPTLKINHRRKRSLTKGYIDSMAALPPLYLVLGAWAFPKIGINPVEVDSNFWSKFYKCSERCMAKFSSHQQTMLLTVLSLPSTEPPTAEWLSMLMAAIDSTPADSASGAALVLWNLMLLHQHLDDPARESKDLLDIVMENMEKRILKFYKHWLKGTHTLKTLDQHLFSLYAMHYFGLEAKVGKRDIERWCKCMEKYAGTQLKSEQRENLEKIIDVYKLPDCFRKTILKE